MSSSITLSCSNTNSKQRKHFPVERRPRMLKDFLSDDLNSCSSSGFRSFPRRVQDSSIGNLIQNDLNMAKNASSSSNNTKRLLRSRSKAAASSTVSAFQAIINTVKSIKFNVVKSHSILPRSLSRKLSRKNSNKSENKETDIKITVRVKDIIRWKSFRDLIEEKAQPSDLAAFPDYHCTTATTTTGSMNSTTCSSNGSSWCDSDFTSEYLPSSSGDSEGYCIHDVELGKKISPCVGRNSMKATTEAAVNSPVGPKELELTCEEKEQRSPVSVLDFEVEEDEDSLPSSFDQTLANMEKTKQKLMQKIRRSESLTKIDPTNLDNWMSMEESDDAYGDDEEEEEEEKSEVEERAKQQLNHVKATSTICSNKDSFSIVVEQLLLDFFVNELSTRGDQSKIDDIDSEMIIRQAVAWYKGEHSITLIDREACVRDMDSKESWSKFEDERHEVGLQIENFLLNILLDELLADVLGHNSFPGA